MKSKKRIKNKLGNIGRYFDSDDWERVKMFLSGQEKISKFILKTRTNILRFFPDCDLSLNVGKNLNEDIIFILICPKTKEPEDKILKSLDRFDDMWWIDNSLNYDCVMVDLDLRCVQ